MTAAEAWVRETGWQLDGDDLEETLRRDYRTNTLETVTLLILGANLQLTEALDELRVA